MKNKLYLTFAFLCFAALTFAQKRVTDIGIEFQAYPTGFIPGLRFEKSFTKRDLYSVRLGYQIIDHRDQGEHDSEKGSGFGGTVGFKHYFDRYFNGANLGLRTDVWLNSIDWESKDDMGGTRKGTTDIIVVQPTMEFGWGFLVGENMVITPSVAFGFEINAKTDGEPTGEGAIFLAGIMAAYRLQ